MRSRLEPKRVVSARLAFNARGADLSSNTLVHIYINRWVQFIYREYYVEY